MKDTKSLETVRWVAQLRERNAARQLGIDKQKAEEQQKMLGKLLIYSKQSSAGFQSAAKAGLPAAQMRDYQLFMNHLDAVVEQQEQHVTMSQQNFAQSKINWQGMRSRSQMIDKVVEERQQQENQKKDDCEQQETDDKQQILRLIDDVP